MSFSINTSNTITINASTINTGAGGGGYTFANSAITNAINAGYPALQVSGDLEVKGDLTVTGKVTINEETWDGEKLKKLRTEERLREKYPALQDAYDKYLLILKMVEGSEDED